MPGSYGYVLIVSQLCCSNVCNAPCLCLLYYASMDMLNYHYKFLSRNIRGLNNAAKQEDVR
jgi:hypothetical protein